MTGEQHGGVLVVGLHHVQISCPAGSEEALRGFYSGILGMVEVPKPPVLAARGGVWFRAGAHPPHGGSEPQGGSELHGGFELHGGIELHGGFELHCGVEEGFAPARKAHPGFAVVDVDAAAERVAAAGLPVRWDDAIPGVRRFHTEDPVGNRVELQQA